MHIFPVIGRVSTHFFTFKAPLSLEEVQVELHCWAKEGLDTGAPLSPAWCACIARLATCCPQPSSLTAVKDTSTSGLRHGTQAPGGSTDTAADQQSKRLTAGKSQGLRRLYLNTSALQVRLLQGS